MMLDDAAYRHLMRSPTWTGIFDSALAIIDSARQYK